MLESWCLAPLELRDDLTDFVERKAQLEQLVNELHRNKSKSLAWRLKYYEEMDLRFDALESALTLKLIESSNRCSFVRLQGVLLQLTEVLAEKTGGLIEEALTVLDNKARPPWLSALSNANEESITVLHEAGLAYHVSIEMLKQQLTYASRFIDGFPAVLKQRLAEFKDKGHIASQLHEGICFDATQNYFSQLIAHTPKRAGKISLYQLREIERLPWSEFEFSFRKGINIVSEAFSVLDEVFGEKVLQAYSEGRIRLLKQEGPSLCIDTPAGSYIQLYYENDVESLILLAHECGHLVHQETVREHYMLKQDISCVLSEAIALFFEHYVACYWFEKHGLLDELAAWRKRQEVEWCHRHQLLALFELQLYGLKLVDEGTVTALWQSLNQGFYPAIVEFDAHFLSSWQELSHIINSPFYNLIYPYAFGKLKEKDLKVAIRSTGRSNHPVTTTSAGAE